MTSRKFDLKKFKMNKMITEYGTNSFLKYECIHSDINTDY